MKRILLLSLVITVALAAVQTTDAKPRGNFGLGIILGEPTGLDAKWFLNAENAVEAGLAWSFSGNDAVHIQVDYLYHFYDWIKVTKGLLPVFIGIGGRLALIEHADDSIGIRIPIGLDYEFDGGVIDIFGELVPVLELTPDTDFDFEGAIGARFWF